MPRLINESAAERSGTQFPLNVIKSGANLATAATTTGMTKFRYQPHGDNYARPHIHVRAPAITDMKVRRRCLETELGFRKRSRNCIGRGADGKSAHQKLQFNL